MYQENYYRIVWLLQSRTRSPAPRPWLEAGEDWRRAKTGGGRRLEAGKDWRRAKTGWRPEAGEDWRGWRRRRSEDGMMKNYLYF